jgi:hypothetical protein
MWVSNGTQVMEDSTVEQTHCRTNHLTAFAPGFTGLPTAKIDFNYVFTHSSFEQNATIYATVIVVCCSYALLAIFAFYFDLKDRNKTGISVINNNYDTSNPNKYIYEIIVFTGARKDAQTSSQVIINYSFVGFAFILTNFGQSLVKMSLFKAVIIFCIGIFNLINLNPKYKVQFFLKSFFFNIN